MLVTAGTKRSGMDRAGIHAGRAQAKACRGQEIQVRALAPPPEERLGRKARGHLGPHFVAAPPDCGSEHRQNGRWIANPADTVFENSRGQPAPARMEEGNAFRGGQEDGNAIRRANGEEESGNARPRAVTGVNGAGRCHLRDVISMNLIETHGGPIVEKGKTGSPTPHEAQFSDAGESRARTQNHLIAAHLPSPLHGEKA